MHAIEAHLEVFSSEEGPNLLEVEERLHHLNILVGCVDHRHPHVAELSFLNFLDFHYAEFDICSKNSTLLLSFLEHGIRETLWCWTSVRTVELDAEVSVSATWVVTSCEENSTEAGALFLFVQRANHM